MVSDPRNADIDIALCEQCGYTLKGLAPDDACPECGMPVTLSLPRKREGTPWQQKSSIRSLLKTWWMLHRSDSCWREMRINRSSRRSFVGWSKAVSYSTLLIPAIWIVLIESASAISPTGLIIGVFALIIPIFVVEALTMLHKGMIGFRIGIGSTLRKETEERAAHDQVLDHACVGMLIAPVFITLGAICFNIGIMIEGASGSMLAFHAGLWTGGILAAIGLLLGLLFHELNYRCGWKAMRYRRLLDEEQLQAGDEQDDEDLTHLFGLAKLLNPRSARELWQKNPACFIDIASDLILTYIVSPAAFLIIWIVYGLPIVSAVLIAIMGYAVLSISRRMLMVPLKLILKRA